MDTIKCTNVQDLANIKKLLPDSSCVVALGLFDGVHIAHRELFKKARMIAEEKRLPFAVFTFFGENKQLKTTSDRIFSDSQRLGIIEECGADLSVIADFSLFIDMSKEEFVKNFLVDKLNTDTAVCGYNFRFGKGASGDSKELSRLMAHYNRNCFIMDDFLYEGASVSSTRIRKLISEGSPREAAKLLGKPYFIEGTVLHGKGLGKGLGFPTVNLELNDFLLIPKVGVYATVTEIDGRLFPAITNIGSCPTFGERSLHSESYILEFNGNLYGTKLRFYLIDYLRDECKFKTQDDLILQINIDKNKALSIFEELSWQEIGLK